MSAEQRHREAATREADAGRGRGVPILSDDDRSGKAGRARGVVWALYGGVIVVTGVVWAAQLGLDTGREWERSWWPWLLPVAAVAVPVAVVVHVWPRFGRLIMTEPSTLTWPFGRERVAWVAVRLTLTVFFALGIGFVIGCAAWMLSWAYFTAFPPTHTSHCDLCGLGPMIAFVVTVLIGGCLGGFVAAPLTMRRPGPRRLSRKARARLVWMLMVAAILTATGLVATIPP